MTDRSAIELMLVEDNPQDIELTLRALRHVGLVNNVHVARDGGEALEFIFCEGAHAGRKMADGLKVILLDLRLLKVDGFEVLRRVKGDARTKKISVVVLTASHKQSDVIESYRLGVDGYVVKPVNLERFAELVCQLGLHGLSVNHAPV